MKKILLISAILISTVCYKTEAQVSVNINIGRQPVWGPVGYDYVNYYYLPDLGVYYDVPRGMFVYFDFGRWNFASSLPARFGHYDLYHSYKVVVNDRNPWLRNTYYRNHYASYRGRYQSVIRDSHDNRYIVARQNYEHAGFNNRRPEVRTISHKGDRHDQRIDRKKSRGDHGHDHDRH